MSPKETLEEKTARKAKEAQEAYDEQEKLIEENRQGPVKAISQVIRWAYHSKINKSVYCMNENGFILSAYAGRFDDVGARILASAPPEAEFYTSFSGELHFVPQTREQWGKGLENENS